MNFFTELKEGLAIAWDATRSNKMRAALTMLGIIIGITTVTLMGTAINGLNEAFHRSISHIGADVLYVSRINWMVSSRAEWERLQKRPVIPMVQVREVERQFALAQSIAPAVEMRQPVAYQNHSSSFVPIIGTSDQYAIVSGLDMGQGRFMSPMEAEAGHPVCILGTNVAAKLFMNESAIGKRIRIGQRRVEDFSG